MSSGQGISEDTTVGLGGIVSDIDTVMHDTHTPLSQHPDMHSLFSVQAEPSVRQGKQTSCTQQVPEGHS